MKSSILKARLPRKSAPSLREASVDGTFKVSVFTCGRVIPASSLPFAIPSAKAVLLPPVVSDSAVFSCKALWASGNVTLPADFSRFFLSPTSESPSPLKSVCKDDGLMMPDKGRLPGSKSPLLGGRESKPRLGGRESKSTSSSTLMPVNIAPLLELRDPRPLSLSAFKGPDCGWL